MSRLTTTNIVGTASSVMWSQAQSILHDDGSQLLIVIQLSCEEGESLVDLATIGGEILSEIEKKGESRAEQVVGEATQGLKVAVLVASWRENDLSLYGKGQVSAYMARNGKLAKLRDDWGEGERIHGMIMGKDTLILSTNRFIEVVGTTKLKEILTSDEEPAEPLAPLVHTQSETSGIAAIVGVMREEKKQVRWPQIKLRLENDEPRKINLWIGGVIMVLLILMIGVGMVRRVRVLSEREYGALNTSVNTKLDEVTSIGDLNPERAKDLLVKARGEVEAYLNTDIKDEYKDRGNKLLGQITSAEEKAFKKNEVKLTTMVELAILADNLRAEKMNTDGKGNLVFLDSMTPRVVAMNLVDRSRQIITINEDMMPPDVAVSEARTYGLYAQGVVELIWRKEEVKKVIEADEFWKEPKFIETFAGNVYIFDREQSEIWKYPTLGDIFGSRRRWFAAGITPDLSNVVDMKVVGDVWLLTSTGKLERYSRGVPVTFPMEGFPTKSEGKKLSEPTALWVTDSLVYVLENGAGRIVVFGADGKYQAQYTNPEFSRASDLVVVDDKVYVLIENTVKEFLL
ncbi:MAG: hypothetical protein ABII21_03990 [bacterium]